MRACTWKCPAVFFTALLTYSGCDVTFIIVSQSLVNGYRVGILIAVIYILLEFHGFCFSLEFDVANFMADLMRYLLYL